MLISFEGCEGGGKTTQIKLLKERLEKTDPSCQVISLREPGGTLIGEQIRQIVLSPENKDIAFATEVLLFQAQRAQLYEQIVLPALAEGKIVLMDRTRDSSVVYQGIVRRFGKDLIDQLNTISTHDTYPDITFLLDLAAKIGLDRRANTGSTNRIDQEDLDFHQQVREAYLSLAKADVTKSAAKNRWRIIDATKSMDEVAEEIWTEFSQFSAKITYLK